MMKSALNKFRMSKIRKVYVLWPHQKKPNTFFVRIYDENENSVSNYMQKHLLMVKSLQTNYIKPSLGNFGVHAVEN